MNKIIANLILVCVCLQQVLAQQEVPWKTIGPFGGSVSALIALDDTLFAGSDNGIFKSTDNGAHWKRNSEGLPSTFQANRFLYNDTTLFLATNKGVYTYEFAHARWKENVSSPLNVIRLVSVQENNLKVIYATEGAKIYRSANQGQYWSTITGPFNGVQILALGTLNHDIFVATSNGIYKSANNRSSWKLDDSMPEFKGFSDFKDKDGVLYGIGYSDVYTYTIASNSWVAKRYLAPQPYYSYAFTNFEIDDSLIYLAINYTMTKGVINPKPSSLILTSNDSGLTWNYIRTEGSGPITNNLTINSKYLSISENFGGIYRYDLSKGTWQVITDGLNNRAIQKIGLRKDVLEVLINYEMQESDTLGTSWTKPSFSHPPSSFKIYNVFKFLDTSYCATDFGIYWTPFGQSTWTLKGFLAGVQSFCFAASATNLYAGVKDGIYRQDGNGYYTLINDSVVSSLTFDSNVLYAISSDLISVYKIPLNTKTAKKIDVGIPNVRKTSVLAYKGKIFVSTDEGIYCTSDGGASWNISDNGINQLPINKLLVSDSVLYAAGASGKVFRSTNSGVSWKDISKGLPENLSVNDLAGDLQYLYASTNGNSIYKLPVARFYPPAASSGNSSGITASTALISGSGSSNGYNTNFVLEYGSDKTFKSYDSVLYSKNPVVGTNVSATFSLSALSEGTTYYYRLKAVNSAGVVTFGSIKSFTTLAFTRIDTLASSFYFRRYAEADSSAGNKVTAATSPKIGVVLNQLIPGTRVSLHYGSLSRNNFRDTVLSSSTGTYTFTVPPSFFDEIGVSYAFTVNPPAGYKSPVRKDTLSDTMRIAVHYAKGLVFPWKLRTGSDSKSYNLLSFPLVLKDNKAGSVVYRVVGVDKPDDTKYRLLTYVGKNGNYKNIWRINPETLESGLGYWFAARSLKTSFTTGEGSTVANHPSFDGKYYTVLLDTGYNQIGNPFLLSISWNDVLTASKNPMLGPLIGFVSNGDSVSLSTMSSLSAFSGAYIRNKSKGVVSLKIPAKRNTSLAGARLGTEVAYPMWVGLSVESGFARMSLGGLGIQEGALIGLDDFDEPAPPLPGGFPQLLFSGGIPLLRDIQPEQEAGQVWSFDVSGLEGAEVSKLGWHIKGNIGDKQLLLEDVSAQRVIEMEKVAGYSFSGNRHFNIYYGTKDYLSASVDDGQIGLQVSPVPSYGRARVTFQLADKAGGGDYSIQLNLVDLTGKRLKTLEEGTYTSGTHSIEITESGTGAGTKLLELLVDENASNGKRYYVKVVFR